MNKNIVLENKSIPQLFINEGDKKNFVSFGFVETIFIYLPFVHHVIARQTYLHEWYKKIA